MMGSSWKDGLEDQPRTGDISSAGPRQPSSPILIATPFFLPMAPAAQAPTQPQPQRQCEECRRTFKTTTALTSHLAAKGHMQSQFCSPCRRVFKTPKDLKGHVEYSSKHPPGRAPATRGVRLQFLPIHQNQATRDTPGSQQRTTRTHCFPCSPLTCTAKRVSAARNTQFGRRASWPARASSG
ncbi:hypothetical protein F4780DRAFT_75590 [Xylariomycetidae sp. FL0641]|nr:hypothetical protein F4780DRAFT_75590 [Xylariomycetidae sp. FL0641]